MNKIRINTISNSQIISGDMHGSCGSQMEDDRFEFSFHKTRAAWNVEQREYAEFSRKFDEKYKNDLETDGNFFDENQKLL